MKILIFLFCFTVSYSQHSGVVRYNVLMPENEKVIGTKTEDFFKDIQKTGSKRTYTLEFNATQAHFFLNKGMKTDREEDNVVEKVTSILIGSSNYYDRGKRISINENNNGALLEDDFSKDWVISTENKKVSDYLCYKATYVKYFKKNNETKSRIITAWFAPSLPYPFGPKGYNGLPGLVLELSDNDIVLFVDSIAIQGKPIEIKFPKGKVISEEEYLKNATYYKPGSRG